MPPRSPSSRAEPPRAWQRMLSGRRLDLLDPSPLDVEIEDIAHGLARVARWNGQTCGDHAFSVAQHCLIVEEIARTLNPSASPATLLVVLLHDAPEYVIGDMISPFKAVMGGNYKQIEKRLEAAIHMRFSLPAETPAALHKFIKQCDVLSAYFEAVELAGFSRAEAGRIFGEPSGIGTRTPDGPSYGLTPLPTAEAQAAFIARFNALEVARKGTA